VSASGSIGAAGEAYVAGKLARDGYQIIARNWRARVGELDIVAVDGEVLAFVEVRVRTGSRLGSADESVDAAKLARLFATANQFILMHEAYQELIWRVDLVAITLSPTGEVVAYRHYQNLTAD
jgi:putative endonuclease